MLSAVSVPAECTWQSMIMRLIPFLLLRDPPGTAIAVIWSADGVRYPPVWAGPTTLPGGIAEGSLWLSPGGLSVSDAAVREGLRSRFLGNGPGILDPPLAKGTASGGTQVHPAAANTAPLRAIATSTMCPSNSEADAVLSSRSPPTTIGRAVVSRQGGGLCSRSRRLFRLSVPVPVASWIKAPGLSVAHRERLPHRGE